MKYFIQIALKFVLMDPIYIMHQKAPTGPFSKYGLTLIPASISNYIQYKVTYEIPFHSQTSTVQLFSLGIYKQFNHRLYWDVIAYLCLGWR